MSKPMSRKPMGKPQGKPQGKPTSKKPMGKPVGKPQENPKKESLKSRVSEKVEAKKINVVKQGMYLGMANDEYHAETYHKDKKTRYISSSRIKKMARGGVGLEATPDTEFGNLVHNIIESEIQDKPFKLISNSQFKAVIKAYKDEQKEELSKKLENEVDDKGKPLTKTRIKELIKDDVAKLETAKEKEIKSKLAVVGDVKYDILQNLVPQFKKQVLPILVKQRDEHNEFHIEPSFFTTKEEIKKFDEHKLPNELIPLHRVMQKLGMGLKTKPDLFIYDRSTKYFELIDFKTSRELDFHGMSRQIKSTYDYVLSLGFYALNCFYRGLDADRLNLNFYLFSKVKFEVSPVKVVNIIDEANFDNVSLSEYITSWADRFLFNIEHNDYLGQAENAYGKKLVTYRLF